MSGDEESVRRRRKTPLCVDNTSTYGNFGSKALNRLTLAALESTRIVLKSHILEWLSYVAVHSGATATGFNVHFYGSFYWSVGAGRTI